MEALSRSLRQPITRDDLGLPGEDDDLGLAVGPDPINTLVELGSSDLNRRRFVTTAAFSVAASALPLQHAHALSERGAKARTGGVAGRSDVQAVRDMTRTFQEIDERHGGQHGRAALVQYLVSDVSALCRGRFATDEERRQMLSAAAVAVHLAGWKAYDAGEQGLAQRYYHQAYALAVESEVVGHDGFVLRTLSQQGLKIAAPGHSLALADSALDRARGKVDPDTEALFTVTRAHALAVTGQRRAAVHELARAHALADGPAEPPPFWATSWGPAKAVLHSRSAKILAHLGDAANAADAYGNAAASRPDGFARIHALDLNGQAKMQLVAGGIEQACATWNRAMDSMEGVASTRLTDVVSGMRSALSPFHQRGVRAALQLEERAAAFLVYP
ncbi:hypothetical protein LO772_16280 [Yinghuangia sp. ASG 101]|uniref:hypothetical protein n=1 Tax=Yinghuangia sp. ASG 101 TaxID=2896848 RepID=UPI001E4AFFDF|nr:hypothetical protein [Yinghuangia sp. ASG 101]UGQ14985.1 hypothetical protein LO772_16280 [Yinghuangia sp. ASG 101]